MSTGLLVREDAPPLGATGFVQRFALAPAQRAEAIKYIPDHRLALASGGLMYLVVGGSGKLRAVSTPGYPRGHLSGVRFGVGTGRSLTGGAKRRQR
jgi:hypothetical protein